MINKDVDFVDIMVAISIIYIIITLIVIGNF